MALTMEKIQQGWVIVRGLPSFPVFCAYLAMIALSSLWQKVTYPLNLQPVLIVHNFACCLASTISMVWFVGGVVDSGTLYNLQPSMLLEGCFNLYWLTKNLELLDTVFMILRHRRRQISFLHVYHHSTMLLLSDLARLAYPWPAIGVYLGMNSFVHVFLYLYYALAAMSPDDPPQWKRAMTQLQIVQFVIGFFIAFYGYMHHGFCVYSMLYGITMTTLFSNFYYHAYVKSKTPKSIKGDNGYVKELERKRID